METKWKERTTAGKIQFVSILSISLIVIVLCVLQLMGIWEESRYLTQPLLGVLLLLQAADQWRQKNRGTAIFSMCAALFVIGCTVAILLMR